MKSPYLFESRSKSLLLPILITFVIAFILYIPWTNPNFRVALTHDNLEAEIVFNRLIGLVLANSSEGASLALNGNLPTYAFTRLFQPLSVLYAVLPAWTAYATLDVIERSIAFAGVFLLCRRKHLPPAPAALAASCFATMFSYSVFLLSIAGIPLILWMALKRPDGRLQQVALVALTLFIGANSSLPLVGVFMVLAALPTLRYGLGLRLSAWQLIVIGAYGLGLALGNANLIYAQLFSGVVWHRVELIAPRQAISYTFYQMLVRNPFYHASAPLQLLLYPLLAASIFYRRHLYFVGFVIFMWIMRAFYLSPLAGSFAHIGFEWDRFFFLLPAIAIVFWIMHYSHAQKAWQRNGLLALLIVQFAVNFAYQPQVSAMARSLAGREPLQEIATFPAFYRYPEMASIHHFVKGAPVMSVGLDPMVAPMNRIKSIDGYYNFYPLWYKHAFRPVIADTLNTEDDRKYFDDYGSRVYAFNNSVAPELIDYCKAFALGARYVISTKPIAANVLTEVHPTGLKTLRLYRVSGCRPLGD